MRRIPLGAGVGAPPAAFRSVAGGNVSGREAGQEVGLPGSGKAGVWVGVSAPPTRGEPGQEQSRPERAPAQVVVNLAAGP